MAEREAGFFQEGLEELSTAGDGEVLSVRGKKLQGHLTFEIQQ